MNSAAGVTIKLPFAPPYHWDALIEFLGARAIPGVESVTRERYRRTIVHDGMPGIIEVRPVAGMSYLSATVGIPGITGFGVVVERLRYLFDVGADPLTIARTLSTDDRMARMVKKDPGVRVPGAWDGFELAVRAILGQQVSVRAANTLVGRLVVAYGTPLSEMGDDGLTHLFPSAETIAALQPDVLATTVGMPRARAVALTGLAAAVVRDATVLQPGRSLEDSVEMLCMLPGIGAWTAHYIAMRVLREPDAFPVSDLGVRRALADGDVMPTGGQIRALAEVWRPWRAYATMYLWRGQ
jgi:AraC family transcriptional regulator of adaptative response / DNA-3-methyladenine glycosylase II